MVLEITEFTPQGKGDYANCSKLTRQSVTPHKLLGHEHIPGFPGMDTNWLPSMRSGLMDGCSSRLAKAMHRSTQICPLSAPLAKRESGGGGRGRQEVGEVAEEAEARPTGIGHPAGVAELIEQPGEHALEHRSPPGQGEQMNGKQSHPAGLVEAGDGLGFRDESVERRWGE